MYREVTWVSWFPVALPFEKNEIAFWRLISFNYSIIYERLFIHTNITSNYFELNVADLFTQDTIRIYIDTYHGRNEN